jgi:hypothetical protein
VIDVNVIQLVWKLIFQKEVIIVNNTVVRNEVKNMAFRYKGALKI